MDMIGLMVPSPASIPHILHLVLCILLVPVFKCIYFFTCVYNTERVVTTKKTMTEKLLSL